MNDPLQGVEPPQSNGMAIAALIIGITSIVLAIIPIIGFLAWITSPLAIILGALALKKAVGKGVAIGGIVTGVIGLLICIAWAMFFGAVVSAMPEGAMQDIQAEMERAAAEAQQQQNGATDSNAGDYQATPVDDAASTGTGSNGGK